MDADSAAAARPARREDLRAACTVCVKSSFYSSIRSPVILPVLLCYLPLFTALALAAGDTWPHALIWGALGLTGTLLFGTAVQIATPIHAYRAQDQICWVSPDGAAACITKLVPAGYQASNFSAWPVGHHHGRDFLNALCAHADLEQRTITGTATNRAVYEKVYQPRGFVITHGRRRPKIARPPV